MRILAIDAALARCQVSILKNDTVLAASHREGQRGQLVHLAVMIRSVLAEADPADKILDLIAVTVGPGSFTGIRAALSLARGMGLAFDLPVIGVTIGEALSEALPQPGHRRLWCAIESRRGRVFIECDGAAIGYSLDALPLPLYPVAVAGDAAIAVAATLTARGSDVRLTAARLPSTRHIAMAALKRHRGDLPPRAAQPFYVDPPEAKLPRIGPRPEPGEAASGLPRKIS